MNETFIAIVSGLPRSGTSMMMQVLQAGGMQVLTDNLRREDQDNPKGYFEFEPVKKTKEDPSWVARARGKAVKMIYRLVYDLPDSYEYRVIFLRRDMEEVLASQKKMLQRSGKQGAKISDQKLADLFRAQLMEFDEWIASKKNFSILNIDYKDMISSPREQCIKVNDFLGKILDIEASSRVVDPDLYRNRA
jgi:uncharacterized protein YcaQ